MDTNFLDLNKHHFFMKPFSIFFSFLLVAFLSNCTNNSISPDEATIEISFVHLNNEAPLELDNIKYTNNVGQAYSIKTVKYFVSKITFHNSNGTDFINPEIHYVDIRDSETLALELSSKIPFGSYNGISFVYGLVLEDNITGSLGIELDRLMEWPEPMGGGYHYMKLEGEYVDNNVTSFFNFHAGGLNGKDYEIYIDLPNSAFGVDDNLLHFNLEMEISNWFQTPVDWDFAYWGSGMMGNPDAQATVQKNGVDVFSITFNPDIN